MLQSCKNQSLLLSTPLTNIVIDSFRIVTIREQAKDSLDFRPVA